MFLYVSGVPGGGRRSSPPTPYPNGAVMNIDKAKKKFMEGLQKAAKLKEDRKLTGPMLGRSYKELAGRVKNSPAHKEETGGNIHMPSKFTGAFAQAHLNKRHRLKMLYTQARHGYGAN